MDSQNHPADSQNELERLVAERTADLLKANEALQNEISEHRKSKEILARQQKQLRRLANEIILVEEKERRVIAADLHDGIGQTLALIKSKITDLQGDAIFSGFSKNLSTILRLLDNAIKSTRSLTFEISSPVLYELGLVPAIRWLATQFLEKNKFQVEVHEKGRIPPVRNDLRVMLFKCVRELIVNTIKHAQTDRVDVYLEYSKPELAISVEDKGIGFDPAKFDALAVQDMGFGLFSIRERLEQLDGQMDVNSTPGQGTKITLSVSLS